MPDSSGAVDLTAVPDQQPLLTSLSEEEQEALAAMAEHNPEPEGVPVRTAFIVYIEPDGTVNITPDLAVAFVRQHIPSNDEVYGAVKTVAKDIEVQETAVATATTMQQIAMNQARAMQEAQMRQKLGI
jgi:hypothetical protein